MHASETIIEVLTYEREFFNFRGRDLAEKAVTWPSPGNWNFSQFLLLQIKFEWFFYFPYENDPL